MIDSKEEFNELVRQLEIKERENELGKSLQTKLEAFKEVEVLINNLITTDNFCVFSEDQMEKAYTDGQENERQRCGYFDITNYK